MIRLTLIKAYISKITERWNEDYYMYYVFYRFSELFRICRMGLALDTLLAEEGPSKPAGNALS